MTCMKIELVTIHFLSKQLSSALPIESNSLCMKVDMNGKIEYLITYVSRFRENVEGQNNPEDVMAQQGSTLIQDICNKKSN